MCSEITLWKIIPYSSPRGQWMNCGQMRSGSWFNIKMTSYQYRKSHSGDETILRPSYLHNGISYTGKMTSLYWIRAQAIKNLRNAKHIKLLLHRRVSLVARRSPCSTCMAAKQASEKSNILVAMIQHISHVKYLDTVLDPDPASSSSRKLIGSCILSLKTFIILSMVPVSEQGWH